MSISKRYKFTEEHRRHIGNAHRGEKNPMYGVQSPMYGKHHTEESKIKIRTNNPNFRKDLTKEKILNTFKNVIYTRGKTIGRVELKRLVCEKLMCSWEIIENRCINLNSIFKELNIDFPKCIGQKGNNNYWFGKKGILAPNYGKCGIKNPLFKKDITKERILGVMRDIIDKYGLLIGRTKLKRLLLKELSCSWTIIKYRCKNMETIFQELNISTPQKLILKGRNHPNYNIMGNKTPQWRENITKEKVLKTFGEIIAKYGKDIGRKKIKQLVREELNCSWSLITKRCGNMDSILQELNIHIPKTKLFVGEKHWGYGKPSPNLREDVTKEIIFETVEEIIDKYNNNIGRSKLRELICQKLKCAPGTLHRACNGNVMDSILHELNINIPRSRAWKPKQDIIEEVVREYEGVIQTRQYHKGIGFPDIETDTKVYDAKSYLYMGWQDQLDRYTQLNKDVRFVVFENKGKTDVPSERIIFLREFVQKLPDNKRLLIQEKIERIKQDIPLSQKSLLSKIESSN